MQLKILLCGCVCYSFDCSNSSYFVTFYNTVTVFGNVLSQLPCIAKAASLFFLPSKQVLGHFNSIKLKYFMTL